MRNLDTKFHIENDKIIKTSNGEEISETEPVFLLRARDRLAGPLLNIYKILCQIDGCNDYQLDGIHENIIRFESYAAINISKMKQPGCTRGK